MGGPCLEQVVLDEFGPGLYTALPYHGGRLHRGFRFMVGGRETWQPRPPTETEEAEIERERKAPQEEMLRRIEGKTQLLWEQRFGRSRAGPSTEEPDDGV